MDFGKKRLGNWVFTKYNKDGVPFIKVSPVSGEFSWEYSAFDETFVHIEDALDSEGGHGGFQTCISIMGMFLHAKDPIFYDLYIKCLEVYAEVAEIRKPTTREEERDIIDKLKLRYEIDEELKKFNEDKSV